MDSRYDLFHIFTRRYGLLNKGCCDPKNYNISLVQNHILYEICRRPNSSMQQISESLGIDITTFSRQIQSLIKKGLIRKQPDSKDKRIFLLSLTKQGEEIEEQITREMNDYLDDIFSYLSEEEQSTIAHSIELLNRAMLKSDKCCLPRK